jgi:hypothetical protein
MRRKRSWLGLFVLPNAHCYRLLSGGATLFLSGSQWRSPLLAPNGTKHLSPVQENPPSELHCEQKRAQ